jgi:hypothetical protein
MLRALCLILLNLVIFSAQSEKNLLPAITQPIPISDIPKYPEYSLVVKELIVKALHLSQMNLTYLYGSADPKNKGMDCSGTIYFLLTETKLHDIPRSSDELFKWAEQQGKLYRVTSNNFNSSEFTHLQAGDLLFWSGTYAANRNSAISHVMIYLDKNNNPIMFGSSDGRTYRGKKMWGVSVFDFKLPDSKSKAKFIGYSCIPQLTCTSPSQKQAAQSSNQSKAGHK